MSSTTSTERLAAIHSDVRDCPSRRTSHLCEECGKMGDKIRMLCEFGDVAIKKPWSAVEEGSPDCAFCRTILSLSWRIQTEGDIIIHNQCRHNYIDPPNNGIDILYADRKSISGNYRTNQMAVFTTEGSPAATANHISGRCIKPASDLSRARGWLDYCSHNHSHGPSRTTSRPSRLVAVGTADGSEPIKIVDHWNPGDNYLTLSYCWGSSKHLCTTSETYESFRTSIPWSKLPKTFQDTIEVARGLEVQFVWIDSLCIIQGDLNDWQIESAKMADIYNNSLLTIMAASASDSHGGLFHERNTIKDMVALPYTDASGVTELSVFVSEALPGYEKTVVNGPLFKRGWVFQERLMSKRKLIFGEDQTYWECNTEVLSESNIRRRDKFAYINRGHNLAFRIFSDPSYEFFSNPSYEWDGPGHEKSYMELWTDLVTEYSRCSLTYDTDRLPSLSGLARAFAQKSGYSYAAGLWQDAMPRLLSWFVRTPSKDTCRKNYCAPSWSWASVPSQASYDSSHRKYELEMVSIDIRLDNYDPYGSVSPGSSINVRGRLKTETLIKSKDNEPPIFSEVQEKRIYRTRLDREGEDLPLNLFYLELSPYDCLLLEQTATKNQFRRLGIAYLAIVGQGDDYFFRGLEKQELTLV